MKTLTQTISLEKYSGRENDLKNKFNSHLTALTGIENNYFSNLKIEDLISLKNVLSDINNLLTLRTSIAAGNWLSDFFNFDENATKSIIDRIDQAKPNTNGFDIRIESPLKIIAEIKCISPINGKDRYGPAQWNTILDDVIKLKTGKKECPDTSNYYKFLFLIDLGERTDRALIKMINQNPNTSLENRNQKRHEYKQHLEMLSDSTQPEALALEKVYVRTIKIA